MKKFLQAMMVMGLASSFQGWAAGNDAGEWQQGGVLQQLKSEKEACNGRQEALKQAIREILEVNQNMLPLSCTLEEQSRELLDKRLWGLPANAKNIHLNELLLEDCHTDNFIIKKPIYQAPEELEILKARTRRYISLYREKENRMIAEMQNCSRQIHRAIAEMTARGMGDLGVKVEEMVGVEMQIKQLDREIALAEQR